MGQQQSVQKVSFEDIAYLKKYKKHYLLNTLGTEEQGCLITGTLSIASEVEIINKAINTPDIYIIIYGKNINDESIYKKYTQLLGLGFINVFIYPGGMFEWLCLQDIYGKSEFPTTSEELDILKYKPVCRFHDSCLLQDTY
tara:strand:- start:224 stop:646 length:423 start_codon:yes stop_codon:yes gene_type:complete